MRIYSFILNTLSKTLSSARIPYLAVLVFCILLINLLTYPASAIPFGNSNGSGGTVYALGSNVINQQDYNDFKLIYVPKNQQKCDSQDLQCFKNAIRDYEQLETRRYYDIKYKEWLYSQFFIFKAEYEAGDTVEIQVSREEGERTWHNAYLTARLYAQQLGFIPPGLRSATHSLTIHNHYNGLMGGSNNIIIFEKRGEQHIKKGSLEEALFHEATHNYFNHIVAKKIEPQYSLWKQAQQRDNDYISYYAKSNDYEDFAESLIAYYAVHYKPDRIGKLKQTIIDSIPNRLHYFERPIFGQHKLDLSHHERKSSENLD